MVIEIADLLIFLKHRLMERKNLFFKRFHIHVNKLYAHFICGDFFSLFYTLVPLFHLYFRGKSRRLFKYLIILRA